MGGEGGVPPALLVQQSELEIERPRAPLEKLRAVATHQHPRRIVEMCDDLDILGDWCKKVFQGIEFVSRREV